MKVPKNIRDLVIDRDRGRCARGGEDVERIPFSVHHRKPRGMGGTKDPLSCDPRNLVLLCGTGTTGCHGEIESNRAEALATGWLLTSYLELDVPLIARDGHQIYLDANGGRIDGAMHHSVAGGTR